MWKSRAGWYVMRLLSRLREPVNGLTHLFGALAAVAGLTLLVYVAVTRGTAWHVVTFAIFGTSLILLYSASAIYHLVPASPQNLLRLRKLDHMMIFVLIAGTYTPICLIPLRGAWGWSLFGAIWMLAIAGIVLKLVFMKTPRLLSVLIYVGMGWAAVTAIAPLLRTMPLGALGWMLLGGVFYTVGAVFYGLKWPNLIPGVLGFHEIWHLFVLAGSISHFWMMFAYISRLTPA